MPPDPTAGTPRTDLRPDDCGILIGEGPRRCNDKAGHATPYHSWFGEPVVTRIEAEASGTGLDVERWAQAIHSRLCAGPHMAYMDGSREVRETGQCDLDAPFIAAEYQRLSPVPPDRDTLAARIMAALDRHGGSYGLVKGPSDLAYLVADDLLSPVPVPPETDR